MSPSSISKTVTRGRQTIINIDIINVGEADANDVVIELPEEVDLDVVSLSTSDESPEMNTSPEIASESLINPSSITIKEGATASLVLLYTVAKQTPLGKVKGRIGVKTKNIRSFLQFTFFITSDEKIDILVSVEDEYTYFAEDNPLLQNAVVTLKNPRLGVKRTLTTDSSGSALFTAVRFDQYTVYVEAENHTTVSVVIVVDGSKSTYSVFLQRSAITYSWSVTKTMFEDKYEIKLESSFETQVPMPVVVIEPAKVNLFPYLEERKTRLEFLVTNYGFIRANNVMFVLPNHPTLKFTQLVENIGDLDANTSVTVPFKVTRKSVTKRSQGACSLGLRYSYVCGNEKTKGTNVALTNEPPGEPPRPCATGSGFWLIGLPLGGSAVGSAFTSYMSSTQLCDCKDAFIDGCLIASLRLPLEIMPGVGCLLDIHDLIQLDESSSDVAIATTIAATAIDCGLGLSCPACPFIFKALNCLDGLVSACKPKGENTGDSGSNTGDSGSNTGDSGSNTGDSGSNTGSDTDRDLSEDITKAKENLENYIKTTEELFGDLKVADVKGDWKEKFSKDISDGSAGDYLLTDTEVKNIMSTLSPVDQGVIFTFLERWNNTFSAWQNGTDLPDGANAINLPKFRNLSNIYLENTRYVKKRGFSTIFQHFDNTITEYKKSRKETKKKEGVCGRVTIHITQELVLTREAFVARLELENGENDPLQEILVDISIKRTSGNGSSDLHLFSIGEPTLAGISDVSGTGVIGPGVEGSAEWFIIPKEGAATSGDVIYDVGGTLSYLHNGITVNVPLLPDVITVSPNPSLSLAYFHEKYVQGDDPFTENIEKSVPFSLSVMVTNKGDGVARNVRITSGQPEIVDNEKGLLVSFKIISAQLGIKPIRPSMTVDFGDIFKHETKTARWFMTTSLKGTFYNYSATFENLNPLGDPELSVFRSISYHQTLHLVRIGNSEDILDDFLVINDKDKKNLPDMVYDSSDGFTSFPVDTVYPTGFYREEDKIKGSKRYVIVKIEISYSGDGWRYSRLVNNFTENSDSEFLLQVIRDDGKDILVPQNSWLTSHYDDEFYFHLFDRRVDGSINSTYTAIFGRKNLHSPTFKKDSYNVEITEATTSQDIVNVEATDIEGDTIFYLLKENETVFTVNENTGMIRNILPLRETGTFVVTVLAVDSGSPPKTGSVSVTVVVTSRATTTTDTTETSGASRGLKLVNVFAGIVSFVLLQMFQE